MYRLGNGLERFARRSLDVIKVIEASKPVLISSRLTTRIAELKKQLSTLSPSVIYGIDTALKTGYTYHMIAIEGNTLSLKEVRLIIEHGSTIGSHSLREHLEAVNIPKALEYIIESAGRKRKLRVEDILVLHSLAMRGIDEAEPGRFRSGYVAISDSKYLPPPAYEAPFLVALEFDDEVFKPEKLSKKYAEKVLGEKIRISVVE